MQTSAMGRMAGRYHISWISMRALLASSLLVNSLSGSSPAISGGAPAISGQSPVGSSPRSVISAHLGKSVGRAHPGLVNPAAAIVSAMVRDYLHPTALGDALIAEQILSEIDAAGAAAPLRGCPPPVAEETHERPHCTFGDAMNEQVLRTSGWSYAVEYNAKGRPKPGLVATAAGSTLDLCFPLPDSLAVGQVAGHQTWTLTRTQERNLVLRTASGSVLLIKGRSFGSHSVGWNFAYLRSYQHMGRVGVECRSGCGCAPQVWNGHVDGSHWPYMASVAQVSYELPVTRTNASEASAHTKVGGKAGGMRGGRAGCPCTIQMKVLDETDSGGYKFKVVGLFSGFHAGGAVNDAIYRAYRGGKDEDTAFDDRRRRLRERHML